MSARPRESIINAVLVLAAVIVGIAISLAIIGFTGHSPVEAMKALADGAVGDRKRMAVTAARMSPLIVVALGWIVAFRAAKVNLGLQGQLVAGGVAAGYVAIEGPSLPSLLALALATVTGIVVGALYASLAAVLWAKRGVNEIVSTLMLTFIAQQLLAWLIRGPIHDAKSSAFQTPPMQSGYRWPVLVDGTPFTTEVFLGLVAVLVVVVLLKRTTFGFKLRLTGENPESARHAGVQTLRTVVLSFVVSGALAGLAGAGMVLGGERKVITGGFGGNVGFTGIVVALVARNSPVGCIAAAAVFAALDTGGGVMQSRAGVPSEIILITQGVIVVLVAASGLLARRLDARAASRATRGREPAPRAPQLELN